MNLNQALFSPVKYRYGIAARKIKATNPSILDVGGYKSRELHLQPYFESLYYTSLNVGLAWYLRNGAKISSGIES